MKYKGISLLPLLTATAVFVTYRSCMHAAHKRLRGKSAVLPSLYGNIEYTEHGVGSDVLVIHAQDDTLQPYRNAEFFATAIPDASLLSFQKGGHIVALIEVNEVGSTVQKHIVANPNELCAQVPTSELMRV